MDFERPPNLRTVGSPPAGATPQTGAPFGSPPPINALAELVADLLASTGLVPADKLALVRGGVGPGGSFAQALIEQDVATSEGVARTLAVRHQMPLVDLALTGVDPVATNEIPLHVLERIVAIPYALTDGKMSVAVADPGNIQGIDELRIASKFPLELAVAPREEILNEIKRLARASEAFGARATLDDDLVAEEEEADDL